MKPHTRKLLELEKTMSKQLTRLTIVLALLVHHAANADSMEHVIDQKNKSFSVNNITIGVGENIKFINSDSYFHNVYSLSETAQFDLGSYSKGDSRTITFDKVGTVIAQCAIHPKMRVEISVEEIVGTNTETNTEANTDIKAKELVEEKIVEKTED